MDSNTPDPNVPDPRAPELGASRPWREIEELARTSKWAALRRLLREMPEADRLHAVSHLDSQAIAQLLGVMKPEDAADLLDWLPDSQAATALDDVDPHAAAGILEQMPRDEQVDLLARMEDAESVLAEVAPESAERFRALLRFDPESAGGLMVPEVFTVEEGLDVAGVVRRIREHPDFASFAIQYIYVVSAKGALRGLVQLRALIVSQPSRAIADLMIASPLAVSPETSIEELEEIFGRFSYLGIPVVDDARRVLGVVRRSAVDEALAESAQSDHMKSMGLSREELRSMPLLHRARRRLAWLTVNVALNLVAASVIAAYQGTLEAAIALAVFLPMISDMSGCSGNQAVAVSMRELSLGTLRPNEMLRVWRQEIGLGAINGIALGLLIGMVAYLWQGSVALGLVVGGALAINTVVAVSIGGIIPLLLRRIDQDPALASGPVLTTITDLCGFFFALSFATAVLDRL
jgi:magnesium transporter